MSALAVCCATRAEARMRPFLAAMRELASGCRGLFGVVLDGPAATTAWAALDLYADVELTAPAGVHATMADLLTTLSADYVLLLDDDERCTPSLARWLRTEQYRTADFWLLPRAWLWPDPLHHLTGTKWHWPDLQPRLCRRDLAVVPRTIHGGWLQRVGEIRTAPYAIEHHKLLLRSEAEREQTVAAYDHIQAGAGFPRQYLPERYAHTIQSWPSDAG